MLKDHQKLHDTRYNRNLISLFFSIHLLFTIIDIKKDALISN